MTDQTIVVHDDGEGDEPVCNTSENPTFASIIEARLSRRGALLGASTPRVLWRHVAPNLAAHVAVATTLTAGNVILVESVLSLLGLGIQPPTPSWGNMLANAQELVFAAPMAAVWPGLAIFVTVVATNFAGDALDPRAELGRL
jgi:peptide/nickel transport system permease protein